MRKNQEYKETTNSSVFKKLHKINNASCSCCSWHGPNSENDRWTSYFFFQEDVKGRWFKNKKKGEGRYPNWKLVSKNKKQWMKKKLRLEESWDVQEEKYDEVVYFKW